MANAGVSRPTINEDNIFNAKDIKQITLIPQDKSTAALPEAIKRLSEFMTLSVDSLSTIFETGFYFDHVNA
jgi:hypothetical protein